MLIVTPAQGAKEGRDRDEEVVRAQITASLLRKMLRVHLNISNCQPNPNFYAQIM